MIKKLHKQLTLLYTVSTGAILTLVLIGVLLVNNREYEKDLKESFNNHLLNITTTIQFSNPLSNSWMAGLEVENRMLIHIEDNGKPLLFQGVWKPKTKRETLISMAKAEAQSLGVVTKRAPISSPMNRTGVFTLSGDHGDSYLASVLVYSSQKGFQSLTLIKEIVKTDSLAYRQRFLFLLFDILGILALLVISWLFMGKSLKPLEENKKKQNEFIAAASHELRSPLAVIRSSASAIPLFPDKQPQLVSNIDRECSRMGRLISDLLVLASADSKRWQLQLETVEPDTLLISTYETYEPLCRAKQLKLTLQLPENPLPLIRGDKLRLEQILSILLDNAISYTPKGQDIFIRAKTTRHHLILQVEDTGHGIPEHEKKAVFERFYRLDASRSNKKHYGLGLSVARELVELHHGKINVTDGACHGACFMIELPIA